MSTPANTFAVGEINRLHAEVVRLSKASTESIHAALVAAWRSGKLLIAEKERVKRSMGCCMWRVWLEQNFRGTTRTAQKYMQLAKTVSDVAQLEGMSLRQVYFNLGIATEPKSRAEAVPVRTLPAHVRLAQRLMVSLKRTDFRHVAPERCAAYRQDLRALYERLRPLFESDLAGLADSPLPPE
jgi:hypothetical protein